MDNVVVVDTASIIISVHNPNKNMKRVYTHLLKAGILVFVAAATIHGAYAQLSSDHVADKIVMHAYSLLNTSTQGLTSTTNSSFQNGKFSFSLTNGATVRFLSSAANGTALRNMNVQLPDSTVQTFVLDGEVSTNTNTGSLDQIPLADAKAFLSAELQKSNMAVTEINDSGVLLNLALSADFQKFIDAMYAAIETQKPLVSGPIPATAIAVPAGVPVTINPIATQKPITVSGASNTSMAVQTTVDFGKNKKEVEINVDDTTKTSTITVGGKTAVTNGKIEIKESKLFLETGNSLTEIAISPEDAYAKATSPATVKAIELKDEANSAVYTLTETKPVKVLYLFPVKLQTETKIGAKKGEIISVKKPWWNFLVF